MNPELQGHINFDSAERIASKIAFKNKSSLCDDINHSEVTYSCNTICFRRDYYCRFQLFLLISSYLIPCKFYSFNLNT